MKLKKPIESQCAYSTSAKEVGIGGFGDIIHEKQDLSWLWRPWAEFDFNQMLAWNNKGFKRESGIDCIFKMSVVTLWRMVHGGRSGRRKMWASWSRVKMHHSGCMFLRDESDIMSSVMSIIPFKSNLEPLEVSQH